MLLDASIDLQVDGRCYVKIEDIEHSKDIYGHRFTDDPATEISNNASILYIYFDISSRRRATFQLEAQLCIAYRNLQDDSCDAAALLGLKCNFFNCYQLLPWYFSTYTRVKRRLGPHTSLQPVLSTCTHRSAGLCAQSAYMRYAPIALLISTGCAAIASAAPVPLPPLPPPIDIAVRESHDSSANQPGNLPNELAARDSNQSGSIAPRSINPTTLIVIGASGALILLTFSAAAYWLYMTEEQKRTLELQISSAAAQRLRELDPEAQRDAGAADSPSNSNNPTIITPPPQAAVPGPAHGHVRGDSGSTSKGPPTTQRGRSSSFASNRSNRSNRSISGSSNRDRDHIRGHSSIANTNNVRPQTLSRIASSIAMGGTVGFPVGGGPSATIPGRIT